jgi:hypothetical protein
MEAIMHFIYIKVYRGANNCSIYADGFYNSMINEKSSQIPSQLIIYTFTPLGHPLQEWQKNTDVHVKASKSKWQVARLDPLNYFNSKNQGGKTTSCCM